MINTNSPYRTYRTRKFTEIFATADDFVTGYIYSGIPQSITQQSAKTLYYLLFAKHGNDPIKNADETQFKYKVWSTIFMYGPSWQKQLEVQQALRELTEDELREGAISINNEALNPGTAPSADAFSPLPNINRQVGSRSKVSKVHGYALLMELLKKDVTADFLEKFDKLFTDAPAYGLLYETEVESDD